MKLFLRYCLLLTGVLKLGALVNAQSFSLESVKSYPFPNELTSAAQGSRIAWVFNEQGKRNVYVAEGPTFTPRKLTTYAEDDGQEISSLSLSGDGSWVVYVRGGDHGSNWDDELPVNTLSTPVPPKVQVWSVPFAGGAPKALIEGDEPVISPQNNRVACLKAGQVWVAPLDGLSPAKPLFTVRGTTSSLQWSPNGAKLAFVCNRGDHSFVGVFTNADTPITWIAPSFSHDRSPQWSPDGNRLVFVRTAGTGGAPDSLLARRHQPWAIWNADAATGTASPIWTAPKTLAGSVPTTHGGFNLHWAAGERIVFLSYQDKWPHLYSVSASGGTPLLLTPGPFMAEHISLSPDRKWLVCSGNTGPDKLDIDRRHVVRVPVDKAAMEVLTPGAGLEWTPVVTGDGATVAMISATAQRPPLPTVMAFTNGSPKVLAQDLIPSQFPMGQLVTPKQVIFKAPDGTMVHGQLFETSSAKKSTERGPTERGPTERGPTERGPAIIYVHGGPPRQMLLGWNYSDYYANSYALNQYLANLGFVVLSVNYRLGIGYGYDFHQPAAGGANGASEYQDVRAAAVWLAAQPQVQAENIGIYGGSYGGYLTALALARDSRLFAAGVDIHGVHDWSQQAGQRAAGRDAGRFERIPDLDLAAKTTWESSPVSSVKTWTSPVLLIHGDDDRNVRFSQSTDLVQRLDAQGVPLETLVIVDDTHHWMKHTNALKMGNATGAYFRRKLIKPRP